LSLELAQLERDFVDMDVGPFVDTQPYTYCASDGAVTGDE
jgi:hypothetical protein